MNRKFLVGPVDVKKIHSTRNEGKEREAKEEGMTLYGETLTYIFLSNFSNFRSV